MGVEPRALQRLRVVDVATAAITALLAVYYFTEGRPMTAMWLLTVSYMAALTARFNPVGRIARRLGRA